MGLKTHCAKNHQYFKMTCLARSKLLLKDGGKWHSQQKLRHKNAANGGAAAHQGTVFTAGSLHGPVALFGRADGCLEQCTGKSRSGGKPYERKPRAYTYFQKS
jgi:hypothetical protein